MKLCVIGGAGARSAFLTKSLVKSTRDIRVDHIVLLDNDQQKLKTYGEISRELSRRLDPDLTFEVTSDARAALTGVDYIITTIRAGGDAGRLFDEQTCLAHGVLGQETTGAGGFAMAIRSVPTLVYYCTLAREVANPGHLIFNFTNPSGIITQALRSKGFDNVYGICDAPSGFIKQLEEILEIPYGTLDIECYGLNHLSWFRNAKVNGRDVQRELLDNPRTYEHSEMRLFTREMARISGDCMLNEYLYFYYRRVSVHDPEGGSSPGRDDLPHQPRAGGTAGPTGAAPGFRAGVQPVYDRLRQAGKRLFLCRERSLPGKGVESAHGGGVPHRPG